MKNILLATVLLNLMGCATADFNYRPTAIRISEPAIGSVNTAYVGDVLLRQGKYMDQPAIYLPQEVDGILGYDLLPGYYTKRGEDEKTETFLPGGPEPGAVDKAALVDPWRAVMAYKAEPTLCIITVFNGKACTKNAIFERKNVPVLTSDSFQQTLIYSGKVGGKINIGYREFSNNHARPAFNNDVEYDLSESNVIGYKGARLEILNATNENIKFRVLKNFNEAVY